MFEETEVSPSTRPSPPVAGEVPPEFSLIRADRPRSIGVGGPGIQPPSLPRTEKKKSPPPPAPPIDDVARMKEVVGVKRKAEEDEEWEEFEPRRTKKKHGGGKQKRWKDDLIGRSVRKFFRGYGYFNGVVDRVFKRTGRPRFRVDWSDNTKSTHPLSNFNSRTTEFNQWELENKEQPPLYDENPTTSSVTPNSDTPNPVKRVRGKFRFAVIAADGVTVEYRSEYFNGHLVSKSEDTYLAKWSDGSSSSYTEPAFSGLVYEYSAWAELESIRTLVHMNNAPSPLMDKTVEDMEVSSKEETEPRKKKVWVGTGFT
ncbi:hypothetical protein TrVE_jg9555 [Triparma verrucosa]|uniref:Uncharacterized protein n=1 Tax=Triparma verrucosa TaxID=1606542 RepID=A0A9W7C4D8_9STRA|nr:hypothetical protein TrVE_jg9555 [Triparma verrucosa]